MEEIWLLVGLGNPGAAYARTRHNAGARALAHLASRLGVRLERRGEHLAAEALYRGERLHLFRPGSWMNISGPPVARRLARLGVSPGRLVVLHDDMDLPLGSVRLKLGGSAGGHRGVESVERALGDAAFYRVRIGLGRPPAGLDPRDYVLSLPHPSEEEALAEAERTAAEAVLVLVEKGLAVAQNRFHGPR